MLKSLVSKSVAQDKLSRSTFGPISTGLASKSPVLFFQQTSLSVSLSWRHPSRPCSLASSAAKPILLSCWSCRHPADQCCSTLHNAEIPKIFGKVKYHATFPEAVAVAQSGFSRPWASGQRLVMRRILSCIGMPDLLSCLPSRYLADIIT